MSAAIDIEELGWAGRKVQHIVPPNGQDDWPALCGKPFRYDDVSYYHKSTESGVWSHCSKCMREARKLGIDPADIGEPL